MADAQIAKETLTDKAEPIQSKTDEGKDTQLANTRRAIDTVFISNILVFTIHIHDVHADCHWILKTQKNATRKIDLILRLRLLKV